MISFSSKLFIFVISFIVNVSNSSQNGLSSSSVSNKLVNIPSGLAAIYKPKGWSSGDVVYKLRDMMRYGFQERAGFTIRKMSLKVGHGGTLDPLAQGVLVMGFGKGTKLMDAYLNGTKAYQAIARLGYETDTYDASGTTTETVDSTHVTYDMIEHALHQYRGDILQTPPMYSALWVDGERLVDLARQGIEVDREARQVTAHKLELVKNPHRLLVNETNGINNELNLPVFGLDFECSGGFYVRSVIRDVARYNPHSSLPHSPYSTISYMYFMLIHICLCAVQVVQCAGPSSRAPSDPTRPIPARALLAATRVEL